MLLLNKENVSYVSDIYITSVTVGGPIGYKRLDVYTIYVGYFRKRHNFFIITWLIKLLHDNLKSNTS